LLSWFTAALILGLNFWLIYSTLADWLATNFPYRSLILPVVFVALTGLVMLLGWITFQPILAARSRGESVMPMPQAVAKRLPEIVYRSILVPLDHSAIDRYAVRHAAALAKYPGAKLYLLHVEEDVTSQIYGPLASTAEVAAGENYLKEIAAELLEQGFSVETAVRYSRQAVPEIIRYAKEINPDLIVMGAHGHKGLKDIIFGTTINTLRHRLSVPLMIVRER